MHDVWKLATNAHDAKLPDELFCVHVCRVHCHRFLKLNVAKKYRGKPHKEVADTWKQLRFAFFSSSTLESFYRRTRDIFVLTQSEFFTETVRNVVRDVNSSTLSMQSRKIKLYKNNPDCFYIIENHEIII
jgi:nucleotidyltransferase/DNA polymerase involved in DNA repair